MMSRISLRLKVGLLIFSLLAAGGCAEMQSSPLAGDLLRAVGGQQGALDESTVAAGLMEALRVGTERAVSATSGVDGFLANELIRIVMPEQLQPVADALKKVGMGSQVDAFETAMNRAAEGAAGEAKEVFWDAIAGMSLADAQGILAGGDTAATDYFRGRTSDSLRRRFEPIVKEKMGEVGAYQIYNRLLDTYTALPFVSKPSFDLDAYVTEKAQDGIFTALAGEERRIRNDPEARSTELLKRVFGFRG